MNRSAKNELDVARWAEVERCQKDLWYLLTEKMDYQFNEREAAGLTEEWHRPVCRWLDLNRDDREQGFWCKRGWHKTTIMAGRMIQELLRASWRTHMYLTGSEDLCSDVAAVIADHLLNNEKLRALDPCGLHPLTGKVYRVFPAKTNKRFFTQTAGNVSLNLYRPHGTKSTGPTIRFRTANAEGTGKHVNGIVVLDDIIGRNTVERSEVQKVTNWVQNTVYRIAENARQILMIGTPWSEQSIHQVWMNDPKIRTLILPGAIAETHLDFAARMLTNELKLHFAPDYKFSHPTFYPVDLLEAA